MSLVANYDSSSDDEELETSTTVKKSQTTKASANAPIRQGLLSSLPPPKKVTGAVKIAMPSVPAVCRMLDAITLNSYKIADSMS